MHQGKHECHGQKLHASWGRVLYQVRVGIVELKRVAVCTGRLTSKRSPFLISLSPTITSDFAQRTVDFTDPSYLSNSSTAFDHRWIFLKFSHSCGCVIRASVPLAIGFIVVSCPPKQVIHRWRVHRCKWVGGFFGGDQQAYQVNTGMFSPLLNEKVWCSQPSSWCLRRLSPRRRGSSAFMKKTPMASDHSFILSRSRSGAPINSNITDIGTS